LPVSDCHEAVDVLSTTDNFTVDHAVNTPVGWDEVKGLPIVDAKKNVDSYAFYALCMSHS